MCMHLDSILFMKQYGRGFKKCLSFEADKPKSLKRLFCRVWQLMHFRNDPFSTIKCRKLCGEKAHIDTFLQLKQNHLQPLGIYKSRPMIWVVSLVSGGFSWYKEMQWNKKSKNQKCNRDILLFLKKLPEFFNLSPWLAQLGESTQNQMHWKWSTMICKIYFANRTKFWLPQPFCWKFDPDYLLKLEKQTL